MEITSSDFFSSIINNLHLEILEHGFLKGDTSWQFYNVSSPFNRLYFVTDGEGRIENENEKVIMKKGEIYLIPLHSKYNYICDYSIQKFYIHFRLEAFDGVDIFETCDKCMLLSQEPFFQETSFEKKFASRSVDDLLELKSYFFYILSKAARRFLDYQHLNIETCYKYQEAYTFMKNNCYSGISVSVIAEHMNISVSALEKSFKLDTGETLKRYINRKLVEKAKEKLLLTDMKVNEVSYLLKFSDEFYFSRFFKKHVGMSPREYRRQNKIL